MRDYSIELENRVRFIQEKMKEAGAKAIVFGNSGGKDSALAGILCSKACPDVIAVMMPCGSKQNYGQDLDDAKALADQFGIKNCTVDLTEVRDRLLSALSQGGFGKMEGLAKANINPRIRMTTLYAIAQKNQALVCGTGNRSERYMGYFTKWGDGAFDFNPIGDLTVKEIYEFLEYLNAPKSIIEKKPSAGLYEGQTDEQEMGITYAAIDDFLLNGRGEEKDLLIMDRYHRTSEHKRRMAAIYGE